MPIGGLRHIGISASRIVLWSAVHPYSIHGGASNMSVGNSSNTLLLVAIEPIGWIVQKQSKRKKTT